MTVPLGPRSFPELFGHRDEPDASVLDVPDPVTADTPGPTEHEPEVDTPPLDRLLNRAVRAA